MFDRRLRDPHASSAAFSKVHRQTEERHHDPL